MYCSRVRSVNYLGLWWQGAGDGGAGRGRLGHPGSWLGTSSEAGLGWGRSGDQRDLVAAVVLGAGGWTRGRADGQT